jgi:hypothetical protein
MSLKVAVVNRNYGLFVIFSNCFRVFQLHYHTPVPNINISLFRNAKHTVDAVYRFALLRMAADGPCDTS